MNQKSKLFIFIFSFIILIAGSIFTITYIHSLNLRPKPKAIIKIKRIPVAIIKNNLIFSKSLVVEKCISEITKKKGNKIYTIKRCQVFLKKEK